MQGRPSAKAKAASSKVSDTTVMQTPDQRTAPKVSYRKRSPKSVAPKAPIAEPTTQANRSMDTISSKEQRPHVSPTHAAHSASIITVDIQGAIPSIPQSAEKAQAELFFTTTKFRISRLISFGFHRFAKVPHPFFANCPIFPSSRLPRTFCSARRTQPADHDA